MYIELTTGKDSFRALGAAARRNCGVKTYALSKSVDTKGGIVRTVVPMFVAYKNKLSGFGKTSLVQTIPATDKFGATDAGQWFVNRHEIYPGTEVLIEYSKRERTGFSERVDYLMVIPRESAPLHRVRIDLPSHPLSAVPTVFFEGRFEIVSEDKHIEPDNIPVWKHHLGLDDEFDVSDVLDPNQDDKSFNTIVLEAAQKAATKARVKVVAGKERVKITRTRRIKTR